jgi:hypothetical protein
MRLLDQVLNTVCFIAKSSARDSYRATGFIASVAGAHGNAYLYLATGKHVAASVAWEPFIIGFNTTQGTKGRFEVNYDPDHPHKWWYHPTEPNAVDVAVFPFGPTEYKYLDIEWIHYPNMFATPEIIAEKGIGIGDEIAAIGLFTAFSGQNRHFPIARIGNLAMLPTERIPVQDFDPMEVYLAEGRSIGGLSGSPVFVRQTINTTIPGAAGKQLSFAGTGPIYFLGLIHGHWNLPVSLEKSSQAEAVNMGISIVVPAHKIAEVLNHPELVEQRKQQDDLVLKEKPPSSTEQQSRDVPT